MVTNTQDPVLGALDAVVRAESTAAVVRDSLARVLQELQASDSVMAWEVVPLEAFKGVLPATIRSCWIFVIRADADTGAERHPNSHQRSFSLTGRGTFELFDGTTWRAHPLVSADDASIEQRSVSIPPSTWHRLLVGADAWGMISFHTVAPEDLIEERPVNENDLDGATSQERYTGRR
jgi:hypothetical protein